MKNCLMCTHRVIDYSPVPKAGFHVVSSHGKSINVKCSKGNDDNIKQIYANNSQNSTVAGIDMDCFKPYS